MAWKRVADRRCVGCGRRRHKNEMIRVSKTKDGLIRIDLGANIAGRGCYICYEEECFAKAERKRAIDRALRMNVSDDTYEEVLKTIRKERSSGSEN